LTNQADRDAVLLRQLGILKPDALEAVHFELIGAGGINSFVGRTLAQMGAAKVRVWDPDTVEEHNRPNQAYPKTMVGWPKAKALAELMEEYSTTDLKVETVQAKAGSDSALEGIVIEAVDSMEARKDVWAAVKMNLGVSLFLDARMGAEIGQVRAVTPVKPSDIRRFEQSLEGKPEELPCTERAIIYNGEMIASLLAGQVKRFVMGQPVPRELVFSFPDLEAGQGLWVTVE
jgi:molybdopterin/thiamine biosynthesis adenylyltransferase